MVTCPVTNVSIHVSVTTAILHYLLPSHVCLPPTTLLIYLRANNTCIVLLLSPGFVVMGIFKGSFTFILGIGCGVYVAQNYSVPDVKKLYNTYSFMAQYLERTYRKPEKDED